MDLNKLQVLFILLKNQLETIQTIVGKIQDTLDEAENSRILGDTET